MADEESLCDWVPPPEVEIVESEVFPIPSGLPSLDEFVKTEIEKEEAAAAEAAAAAAAELEGKEAAAEGEVDAQAAGDAGAAEAAEEGSLAEHAGAMEDEAAGAGMEGPEEEFDMREVDVKKTKKPSKKTTEEFFDMDTVKIDFGTIKQAVEDKAKEELRLRLIESTHNYLDGIIDKVVEICEYEDPDEILRTRLHKGRVSKELDEKLFQLDVEQKVRFFLNRKTVEYFRRKKATRQLTDDSPDHIINELRKYRDGLFLVNRHKGREEATRAMLEKKVEDLRAQVEHLDREAKEKDKAFANLVRRVFGQDSSEKMEQLMDYMLNKVKSMRKEISGVRFILIQRQHTMANLQDKAKKLEDLGNGLKMVDFEHLQTETQALGKKIEERNNELNRLHARCNADIHTLAHIREKQHMIRNTIAAQEDAYQELVIEKQDCREYVNSLKIDRGKIRRETQKISFQGGLLDKPDLLLDYDTTVDKVNALQAKVNEMKTTQLMTEYKMKQMMRGLM